MNKGLEALPPIGDYWTSGAFKNEEKPMVLEAYLTCTRCGAFVNAPDRHEEWHRAVEQ